MLFDLGVSSPQLDDPARGFSYQADAPLDMRMDQGGPRPPGRWSTSGPGRSCGGSLPSMGRSGTPPPLPPPSSGPGRQVPLRPPAPWWRSSGAPCPAAALREKQHPAKRSFQGIRIAVNDELTAISRMLQAAIPRLKTGGRLAVISFHSLEDRIVKSELAAAAKGCDCPPSFPVCVCGKRPLVRLVNRKPILPSQAEQEENPRARSAKLRVAEKLEG